MFQILSKFLTPLITLVSGGIFAYFFGRSSGKKLEESKQIQLKEQETQKVIKNTYENTKLNQKVDSMDFDDSSDFLLSHQKARASEGNSNKNS